MPYELSKSEIYGMSKIEIELPLPLQVQVKVFSIS